MIGLPQAEIGKSDRAWTHRHARLAAQPGLSESIAHTAFYGPPGCAMSRKKWTQSAHQTRQGPPLDKNPFVPKPMFVLWGWRPADGAVLGPIQSLHQYCNCTFWILRFPGLSKPGTGVLVNLLGVIKARAACRLQSSNHMQCIAGTAGGGVASCRVTAAVRNMQAHA